jgi:Flp pilus assembly pilin Flp
MLKKLKTKKAQGLAEYGIILVLIAVAAITTFAFFGKTIKAKVSQISAIISGEPEKENIETDSDKEDFEENTPSGYE